MPVNSKKKGNTFERTISNKLSELYESIINVKQGFRRNIDSGSFFGGKNQKRKDEYLDEHQHFGDIIPPDKFIYSIECKAYKTAPNFNVILKQECKQWDVWIEQAERDACNANKKPLLIVKYNNNEIMVFTKEKNNSLLRYKNYYVTTFDIFFNINTIKQYMEN